VLVAALLEREKRLEGDVGGIMSVTGWVGDVDETMVAETEVFFVLGLFKPYVVLWSGRDTAGFFLLLLLLLLLLFEDNRGKDRLVLLAIKILLQID